MLDPIVTSVADTACHADIRAIAYRLIMRMCEHRGRARINRREPAHPNSSVMSPAAGAFPGWKKSGRR